MITDFDASAALEAAERKHAEILGKCIRRGKLLIRVAASYRANGTISAALAMECEYAALEGK